MLNFEILSKILMNIIKISKFNIQNSYTSIIRIKSHLVGYKPIKKGKNSFFALF